MLIKGPDSNLTEQVPTKMKNSLSKTQVCLVGNGRLATQLEKVLTEISVPFSHIYRSKDSTDSIKEHISKSTHIWLAISDSAIESFYQTYANNNSHALWVHFSGAHNSPKIFSVHPLMTFSKNPMSSTEFKKVHMVLSSPTSAELKTDFLTLMPGFTNPHSILNAQHKALYHALCVVAGNFPMILWTEVLNQFQSLSLPKEALFTYLDRVNHNFKNEGANALSGPIVRNDTKTIKDNLVALDSSPLKPIYESFLKAKGVKL